MPKVSNLLQERFLENFLIKNNIIKSKVQDALDDASSINGIMAVSLIDLRSGILLGSIGSDHLNMEFASILNNDITEKVRNMAASIEFLVRENIDNIVVVCENKIDITYRVEISKGREFYFYLIVDAEKTNIFIVKNKIEVILKKLKQ